MVRILSGFGGLNLKIVIFLIVTGWGIFVLAAVAFSLLKYQARRLDEGEVCKWQDNWERKRGYRRPIREFATVFLKGAKQVSIANLPLGLSVLVAPLFIVLALSGLIVVKASMVWAFAVIEVGQLIPAYLATKMIVQGLRLMGDKILMLAASLEDRDVTEH